MEPSDNQHRLPLLERIIQQLVPRNLGHSSHLYLFFGEDLHNDGSDSSGEDENGEELTTDGSEMQKAAHFPTTISHGCNGKNNSVWRHIKTRELGLNTRGQHCEGFSKADQSCVFSRYLPNSVRDVIRQSAKVFCGTYSEDGSVFMSASQDCHIRLYDTSGAKLRQFQDVIAQNVGWSVVDTAYSHDQRHLIYSSWSPNIYLCDIAGGCHQEHIALNMGPPSDSFCAFSITFSQDDYEILTGSNDNSIYIYDRSCSKRTLRINGHEDDVDAVCFCDSSSQLLFSGSDDGLCKVWDRRTLNEQNPEAVGTFAGHAAGITCIDSKGDGHYLITNCKDQTIKLWDLRAFSNADSIKAGRRATSANQFWDYRWETIPRKFTRARGVKVKGDASVMTYRGHTVAKSLIRSRFSPSSTTGQRYIYTGSANGCIYIYDLHTGEIVQKLEGHDSIVRDVSWHPYRPLIMTSSWDGAVKCWHYADEEMMDGEENEEDEEEDKKKHKRSKRPKMHPFCTRLYHRR